MKITLKIMEMERFAIHDGAGIRTIVFLQGCPLHCPWCSNPESQNIRKQLLYMENKCVGCGKCVQACPVSVISFEKGKPVFHREHCIGCESCANACPQHAIRFLGIDKTIDEVLAEVMRDEDYYEDSGGGITISGGEPFVQYAGFLELLRSSKMVGLNTAVETTGNTDLEKIKEAEPYIDTFLFDFKHSNPSKLKAVTGGDFFTILTNLEYLARVCPDKIILRVPVIPSFNYDEVTIGEIFDIACKNHILKVHLLPFHTLGKGKYAQLGIHYPFTEEKMLARRDLEPFQTIGRKKGLTICIGGG
jgi:pyruvate formate lyase activating enzyme